MEQPEIKIYYDQILETWRGELAIPGEFYTTVSGSRFQDCLYSLVDCVADYEWRSREAEKDPGGVNEL